MYVEMSVIRRYLSHLSQVVEPCGFFYPKSGQSLHVYELVSSGSQVTGNFLREIANNL